jgi:hypothetical protein
MQRVRPIVVLLALAALTGCGGAERAPAPAPRPAPPVLPKGPTVLEPQVTATPEPRITPIAPAVPRPDGRWLTARPDGRIRLRAAPGGRGVGAIGPVTEFGSRRTVSVLARRGDWLKVIVPERPNARPAWIRAARARLGATDVALVIDLSERTLAIRTDGRTTARMPVGIGAPYHPTPTGRFAITDKLRMGGPGTTYGCCALALSAHQPNVPDTWNGLDRIAIHGTQSPQTIGVAASLGCLHARERDLHRLIRLVPIGAPVFIRA